MVYKLLTNHLGHSAYLEEHFIISDMSKGWSLSLYVVIPFRWRNRCSELYWLFLEFGFLSQKSFSSWYTTTTVWIWELKWWADANPLLLLLWISNQKQFNKWWLFIVAGYDNLSTVWLLNNWILHSRKSVVLSVGYLVPQTSKTSSLNSL